MRHNGFGSQTRQYLSNRCFLRLRRDGQKQEDHAARILPFNVKALPRGADGLQLRLGDAWHSDNWIFIQADGKAMYPTTPTLWFSKFLKRHNLAHKKFHALRHTSATLLLSNGTNIKNVAARLGHAQLKTTNRYVHAVEQAERDAADTFENLLHPKKDRTA